MGGGALSVVMDGHKPTLKWCNDLGYDFTGRCILA